MDRRAGSMLGRCGLLLVLLSVCPSVRPSNHLSAQEPLRAAVLGDPQVGKTAPDFTLAYLTSAGPGPADQPFHLRAELGRRVVLVFSPATDREAARPLWDRLVAQRDSLLGPGTVLVGLFREPAASVQALATALSGTFKFLPDTSGLVFRRFGVPADPAAAQVFVIADDGRLVHRARRLALDDAAAWRELGQRARP